MNMGNKYRILVAIMFLSIVMSPLSNGLYHMISNSLLVSFMQFVVLFLFLMYASPWLGKKVEQFCQRFKVPVLYLYIGYFAIYIGVISIL